MAKKTNLNSLFELTGWTKEILKEKLEQSSEVFADDISDLPLETLELTRNYIKKISQDSICYDELIEIIDEKISKVRYESFSDCFPYDD